jgi:hypothetical protein
MGTTHSAESYESCEARESVDVLIGMTLQEAKDTLKHTEFFSMIWQSRLPKFVSL